jgi:predicted DNA-binding protein YlxM (UPF0122 family)
MKQKRTITKHDIIRAINGTNHIMNNFVKRLELLEKNFGEYVEMKDDVGKLKKYRSKKKERSQSWVKDLMQWLKTLLKGKADQK